MLYDFGSSILRSIGDSEHPLYSLIAAVCKRVHEFWVLVGCDGNCDDDPVYVAAEKDFGKKWCKSA